MKKNNRSILKLDSKKRIKISVFLIGVLIPFIALIILLVLQDNLFIELIKNFHQEITKTGSLVSDKENWELLVPLVKTFRENNSYIFLGIGGFSVLLSAIFSIVVSGILGKNSTNKNKLEYNVIRDILNKYEEDGFSAKEKIILNTNNENLNEIVGTINKILEKSNVNQRVASDIEEESNNDKINELKKAIEYTENKVSQLEKEKNEIDSLYKTEKEKNEILFSQIEKMKKDSENEIKKALSNEEKSIDEILNKILYEDEKEDSKEKNTHRNKEKETSSKNKNSKNLLKLYNKNMSEIYDDIKTLCRKKDYQQALQKALIDLSEKEKRVPKFAYLLGYIYAKLGKNRDAKKYIAIVLSVEPNNIEARNLFGVIQYKMGETKDAKQQFNMVLILDPENKTAKENLKRIKIKESKDLSLKRVIA